MFVRLLSLIGIVLFLASCDNTVPDPVTGFSVDQVIFTETNSNVPLSITFSPDVEIQEELSVEYEIRERSARAQDDFIGSNGTLVFTPEQQTATLDLELVGDEHFELSETFEIILLHTTNISYLFSITDDDEIAPAQEDADGFYTPAQYPSMNLLWSDEFNGDNIDLNNWTHEVGEEWFNNELQAYSDDSAYSSVSDGKLTITARNLGGNYISARMITQDKMEFQYGRVDIRARLPKGQGIWPALWMLGANINEVGWPACGEIDIMELVGHEPNIIHGTAHYENNGHQFKGRGKGIDQEDFSERFHVFSIVWERDYIIWLLDGKEYLILSENVIQGFPFRAPYFFIFNVAVGGDWPGNPDATTVFPQSMEVDYIRVFQ